jgi:hypothetical protein
MDPASDSAVFFKEFYFGITDSDVDSSARTAASHSDTVPTVSDFVIFIAGSHSVIIFYFRFRCPYLHPILLLLTPASDIWFLLRFPYQDIYFHIIAPHYD